MEEKECLISCEHINLGYDNKVIVEDFNFQIYDGDYVCVVGENGSGKSTLLKTVLGLTKPVSGQIKLDEQLKAGEIGYLPQQTQIQKSFPASVMEVVMSGFLNKMNRIPFYKMKQRNIALKNLERMEILDLKNRCYGELSGGQQQRVLLARALCAADRLLVLDEPVTGLDPAASEALYDILQKLNDDGMAIIMVTHDLQNIIKRTKKVLHIDNGGYFYGDTKEYMQSDYAKIFSI